MFNKKTSTIALLLTVALLLVLGGAVAVSAQGPSTTPTKDPKAAPPAATATKTALPANTATNTPQSKSAPPTATATKVAATATTQATVTLTRTPTKAATATRTPTKVLAQRASPAFASYSTGFQVQNLGGTTANISLTFYNQDGSVAATVADTIATTKTYFPIPVASGFNGSTIVSSDQPMASIVNVIGGSNVAFAAYDGSSQGSTTVNLPLLMKNNGGFSTWFRVQNAGSSAATATVNYSDGTSANQSINPGASKTFDQSTETHTPVVFSGIVTSAQPLVVSVIEENPSTLFAYTGFASGSTNTLMPLINANNGGYVTGAQIQNAGATTTTVTVGYTATFVGTSCTETMDIPPSASRTFALFAFTFAGPPPGSTGWSSTCAHGPTFVGSARINTNSASQPLVAIVNQLKTGVNGEAYGSFNPSAATSKVVMPLIMDRNGGFYTGFNIMNAGASATNISCTFTGTGYTVSANNVQPGFALLDLQNNKIANGYVGSGTCTATGGDQKIIGVVNELGPGNGQLLVYEGINQ